MNPNNSQLQEILQPQRLFRPAEILKRPSPVPKAPGLYAWYLRGLPDIVPTADCHHYNNLPLVYIGISTNLNKRLRQHNLGPTNSSTLRRTLGAVLMDQLGLVPEMKGKKGKFYFGRTEAILSQWLAENGSVVWLAHPTPRALEKYFLNSDLSLPLNVESNQDHPFRETLKSLRKGLRMKAQGSQNWKPEKLKGSLFPISRSTPSAEALAPFVEANYGLENVQCQLIKGLVLHTYLITASSGRFIFRIYPYGRRTAPEIGEELAFLQHLDQRNIPVSTPIAAQDGRLQQTLNAPEGPRQAALFSYAPGQPFEDHTTTNVHAFGRLLAQLHQTAESFPKTAHRQPFNYQTLIAEPLTFLEKTLPKRQADWDYLGQIAPAIKSTLDSLAETAVLIHGDISSSNIHLTPDGAFTLFDFDLCGPGPRAFDLATFLVDETAETAEALLAGYQSVVELETAEIEAIPHLQIAQNIWLLGLRASYINEWGTVFFPDRLVNNIIEKVSV